ncbi:MAG TPA: hypothetical protein VEF72_27805 [Mycobacterium sp.]|nr:hypothetical protein [Mycobacterium sp.]
MQRGDNPGAAYGRSKLANMLFTYELQRRYRFRQDEPQQGS